MEFLEQEDIYEARVETCEWILSGSLYDTNCQYLVSKVAMELLKLNFEYCPNCGRHIEIKEGVN